MRNRVGRRRNGILAAALAVVAAVAVGGCGKAGDSSHPHKGQAGKLFDWDVDDPSQMSKISDDAESALYNLDDQATGITYGPDGRLRVMAGYLMRFDADRTMHATDVSGGKHVDWESYGLVAEPGGTYLTTRGTSVLRWRPDGTDQVVAGFAAKGRRKAGSAVPASAPVGSVHASQSTELAGERPDGSLVLLDDEVVWSLKDGRLTRLLQLPAGGGMDRTVLLRSAAVNRSGTVWTASGTLDRKTLGSLRTIAPDGTVSRPALPAKAAGVPGKLASLPVDWLADDGADGAYANVYQGRREFVLHLRPGSAVTVAATEPLQYNEPCTISHPVDAMDIPCTIPRALSYHAGHLVAAGGVNYVLTIALR